MNELIKNSPIFCCQCTLLYSVLTLVTCQKFWFFMILYVSAGFFSNGQIACWNILVLPTVCNKKLQAWDISQEKISHIDMESLSITISKSKYPARCINLMWKLWRTRKIDYRYGEAFSDDCLFCKGEPESTTHAIRYPSRIHLFLKDLHFPKKRINQTKMQPKNA